VGGDLNFVTKRLVIRNSIKVTLATVINESSRITCNWIGTYPVAQWQR